MTETLKRVQAPEIDRIAWSQKVGSRALEAEVGSVLMAIYRRVRFHNRGPSAMLSESQTSVREKGREQNIWPRSILMLTHFSSQMRKVPRMSDSQALTGSQQGTR